MRILIVFVLLSRSVFVFSQDVQADSTRLLQEVLIQAYATDRPLDKVAVSVGYVSTESLQRFNTTSFLPAVNTIPGVRMEERSPGSYRFSIRGSLLRSPFGVRNVKAYWNGLPLTDGGGNTYLNIFDLSSIGSIEIIKGPGGSLYGAGTGGVVLLSSPKIQNKQIDFSATTGSYNLQRYQFSAQTHSEKVNARISASHQQSDGYREQTAMKRTSLNTDLTFNGGGKSIWSATIFYTDLSYETSGGLTKSQFDIDPKKARPSTPAFLGTVEQKAAVYNKTVYGGINQNYEWNNKWSTQTGIYGAYTDFKNPTFRNYEERFETNLGVRSQTQYEFGNNDHKSKLTFGAEYQHFKSPVGIYGNKFGVRDTVQYSDKYKSDLAVVFAQVDFDLGKDLFVTMGASENFVNYDFLRLYPEPSTHVSKNFNAVFSPRVAILKKIKDKISIYTNLSKGFSPPSLAEVRPSSNVINTNIKPETGMSYEIGIKANPTHNLSFEVAYYDFKLKNTIIVQNSGSQDEYFANAGKTDQRGLEAMVSYAIVVNSQQLISDFRVWSNYSANHYRFKNYTQDINNFNGNKLTGVAPNVLVSGIDLSLRKKFYTNITANYVDHTPLNDANTAFANEYFLLGARLGYKTKVHNNNGLEFFAGIDNALNKRYSLGNDLNAAGGRYYNAAAPRNFYAGIKFSLTSF
jgi:iron complex outermembrane receptor protein